MYELEFKKTLKKIGIMVIKPIAQKIDDSRGEYEFQRGQGINKRRNLTCLVLEKIIPEPWIDQGRMRY